MRLAAFACERTIACRAIITRGDGPPDVREEYVVRELSLPFWFVLAAFGGYPGYAMIYRRVVMHRRRRNQCTACGYNLTGLTSDRCPECGEAAS